MWYSYADRYMLVHTFHVQVGLCLTFRFLKGDTMTKANYKEKTFNWGLKLFSFRSRVPDSVVESMAATHVVLEQ